MTHDMDLELDRYVKAALGKKAESIVVLDLRGLTSIADAFIICSGRSSRQVEAIAEFIRTDLKKDNIKPLSVEGMKDGHWVLLDYGHVVIHVFYDPIRSIYDLEGFWTDARRIQTKSLTALTESVTKTKQSDEVS